MSWIKLGGKFFLTIIFSQVAMANASKDLLGSWEGVFRCGVTDIYFSLNLQDENGQMSGQFRTHFDKSSPQTSELHAKLEGRVERIGNSVSLQGALSKSNIHRAQSQIAAQFAIDESSGRLFGRIHFPQLQNCSFAVAEKKSSKNLKKSIDKVAKFTPKKGIVSRGEACPKVVKQWLSQIAQLQVSPRDSLAISMYLFRDENFKPYFGKNLYSLSASHASLLSYQVAYGCRGQAPELNKAMGLQSRLYGVLINEGPANRTEFWLNDQAAIAAAKWKARVQARIRNSTGFPQEDISQLKQLLPSFSPLMAMNGEGLDAELQALSTRQLVHQQYEELDALMSRDTEWQTLASVAAFPIDPRVSEAEQKVMQDKISAHLARHWQSAIEKYIAQHSTVKSALHHLRHLHAHPGFAHMRSYLPPGAEADINTRLSAHLDNLVAGFVRDERGRYDQQLLSDNAGLAALERWILIEDQLRKTYQELLWRPEFSQFSEYRLARFRQALVASRPLLLERIGVVQSTTELRELLKSYLPETLIDPATRAPYLAAGNDRLAAIAPFHAMAYADYFNAIYQADLKRVRELDSEYIAALRSMFREVNQAIPFLNFEEAVTNMSLLPGVIAVYLFNYQERATKACLRADATQFEVTSTSPDVVTRNGLGVEVSRTYGHSSRSYYRVNKEFTEVFRAIGDSTTDSLGSRLTEGVLNNGNITRLYDDTRRLMDSYPCDSAQIKTLEKNFIKLYGQLR